MRETNAHLTIEEFLLLVRSRTSRDEPASMAELREHVDQCQKCAATEEQYQALMPKLDLFKDGNSNLDDCPNAATWGEYAAGLLSREQSVRLTRHAATCNACAEQLKEVLEIFGSNEPAPQELQESLKSSRKEWQREMGLKMVSQTGHVAIPQSRTRRVFLPLGFSFRYATAALLLLATALGLYFWRQPPSTETLIAKAYSERRTLALRLPQAQFGDIKVQRGNGQLSSPIALLEAEQNIRQGLDKEPNNPRLLRQQAEVDLLNGNYQPAIETLGRVLRFQPQAPDSLIDLATAYYERGRATDQSGDYEAALQYLTEALRLSPANPAALFNRAIVFEKLMVYDNAVKDWEMLLKVEKNPGWRKEAAGRLQDVHSKQQQHSSNPQERDPEEYLIQAERDILPKIHGRLRSDQNYDLALHWAEDLKQVHGDMFLKDLLHTAGGRVFHEAAQLLGEASSENEAGHSEQAYSKAAHSVLLFQKRKNIAGILAARFEQLYALQFEGEKAGECRAEAARIIPVARQRGYAWIEVQSLIEQAFCTNMTEEIGRAKELTQNALRLAAEHHYQSYYLRAQANLCRLEGEAGDESAAWALLREGLARYWRSHLPAMRAYTFYVLLDRMAERLGHYYVQLAAAHEALVLIAGGPDKALEASERSRLANAALRTGDATLAKEQLAAATQLFSESHLEPSGEWRKAEAQIHLIAAQSEHEISLQDAIASLRGYFPEVKNIKNRYVDFEYYVTLAQLEFKAHHRQQAEQWLIQAINEADEALRSLRTWRERRSWLEHNRKPYLSLAELRFRSGQPSALDVWEHFRTTSPMDVPVPSGLLNPGTQVLTYALTSDGVIVWAWNDHEKHSAFVPVSPSDLKRNAENFINECARHDSDLANLRSDARALYSWLIQPVSEWLPPQTHIVVEPEGIVGLIPFEALLDKSGNYLGERHTITIASSLAAGSLISPRTIQFSDPALIVAAPANGTSTPPEETIREGNQIAAQFAHSTPLFGAEASSAAVQREIFRNTVFHFAGHAVISRAGAAIRLSDADLGIERMKNMLEQLAATHGLSNMKLAVLSACSTARPSEVSSSESLVTELLHAGVPAVVASRWDVESRPTADFMVFFYQAALSGQSIPVALQTAANRLRTIHERDHPYFWAAFSHFGSA